MAKKTKKKISLKKTNSKVISPKKNNKLKKKVKPKKKNNVNGIVKLVKQESNQAKRNAKGQLLPGSTANRNGRPKLGEAKVDELWRAIHCAEKDVGTPWLHSLIVRSYSDTSLALGLLSRLYPALKAIEMSGDIGTGKLSQEALKSIQEILKKSYDE